MQSIALGTGNNTIIIVPLKMTSNLNYISMLRYIVQEEQRKEES